ncbi:phosphotransferase family protein [Salinispora sp. H7-4]|uniref:phosphotransferase family protein n=1 Tax=Salinispora sp. H7-4 TaxID=2748321 RepID=UPI0015D44EEC|nr:phosphotransferase [Salinispora sp. H7-4]NYT95424.1 phosphotransferase [Salinispora sp. H7-4]
MIGAKIGAGREADVHTWCDDAVIKLYRPGLLGHRAEAGALTALAGLDIAPKLTDTVEWDRAATHLAVHQVSAPADLPELRSVLAARITDATMPTRLRDHTLRLLDGLPEGDRLCHGDYHPGNLMLTAGRAAVIDWPNATRGAPAADHARTKLLLRYSAPLPETSRVARTLVRSSRSVFARRYIRAYRAGSVQPPSPSGPWLAVQAAARLAEGIAAERATLIALLERRYHRTGR